MQHRFISLSNLEKGGNLIEGRLYAFTNASYTLEKGGVADIIKLMMVRLTITLFLFVIRL